MSLLALVAAFSAAAAEPPCRSHPEGMALDFWLGDWAVTSEDGSIRYGENSIELAVGGCAVLERWRSATGGEGFSLFAFDAKGGTWDQTWVTADTSKAGGLKRKTLIASGKPGAVFQGEVISDSGAPYFDRTTLTPLDGGRVRQLIEISTDAGATWRPVFDGYYAPR